MGSSWFSSERSSVSVSLPARESLDTPAEVLGKGYPPRGKKNPQQFQFRQSTSFLAAAAAAAAAKAVLDTLQATSFLPYTSLPHSL
ncbi:Mamld1: Mastermind-like domain-containing protein 1 [Crotalus adamanteus]|uniref:Mamld1: Mastermind-like domain-containing protein 1 n=1 Tax=Crotalus adamanteus TaxID=8729 RepID=A0AAW1BR00_CROAD